MRRLVWGVLLLAGCEDIDNEGRRPILEPSACEQGYTETSNASLLISTLMVSSTFQYPTFDPFAEYDDIGAAACLEDEGNGVQLTFESGGEPYGTLRVLADTIGTQDTTGDDTSVQLEFDLFGSPTLEFFALGDFTSGSWVVLETGDTFSTEADITAQGGQFWIKFSADATR